MSTLHICILWRLTINKEVKLSCWRKLIEAATTNGICKHQWFSPILIWFLCNEHSHLIQTDPPPSRCRSKDVCLRIHRLKSDTHKIHVFSSLVIWVRRRRIKFIRHDKNSSDKRKQISIITSINPIWNHTFSSSSSNQWNRKSRDISFDWTTPRY